MVARAGFEPSFAKASEGIPLRSSARNPPTLKLWRAYRMESRAGFQPALSRVAADRIVTLPSRHKIGSPSRIRTSIHGVKVRCPAVRRREKERPELSWSLPATSAYDFSTPQQRTIDCLRPSVSRSVQGPLPVTLESLG